jgi:single-strand DNA-binding protein
MSKATTVFEGFIAEPRQDKTKAGKDRLTVSVSHTPRRKNQTTGEWEDAGDTVWARAAFYDDEAHHLAGLLSKGDFVRVEGEPRLSAYVDKDGNARAGLDLWFPALAIVPRAPRNGASGGGYPASAGQQSQGAWNPPQNGGFDGQPF